MECPANSCLWESFGVAGTWFPVASGTISMYSYFEPAGRVRAVRDKCQEHFLLNAGQEGGQCLRWVGLALCLDTDIWTGK